MVTWDEAERVYQALDPKFEAWSLAQREAYLKSLSLKRQMLFFPTGHGKTKTTLGILAAKDIKKVFVIAPNATHADWRRDAHALGMEVLIMTVQKFRQADTKIPREYEAWAVDEFHQLGGHDATGFGKFKRMMRTYTGEVIMSSATPNYNDPERVFCVLLIGDEHPETNYLDWLWEYCICKTSPFKIMPDTFGYKDYESNIEFLLTRDWVSYIEDKAEWDERWVTLPETYDDLFERFNADTREEKIINSEMEKRHKRVRNLHTTEDGTIRLEILQIMLTEMNKFPRYQKWMIYCMHSSVSKALYRSLSNADNVFYVDGDTTKKRLEEQKHGFINAERGFLIGTSSIATGMDGVDKTCHAMFILDDIVGDDALRRQLIGRILPRGAQDTSPRLVIRATF
jgi:hypothetical protein